MLPPRAADIDSQRLSNMVERMGKGGRSQFAKQIDAERLGFPKTSMASFWGSQR
jgi:hypothetical protein